MGRFTKFTIVTVTILVTFNPYVSLANNAVSEKGGRCPEPKMDAHLCLEQQEDQCADDQDCSGESLCCSTGCNKVCILPTYTACEQVRRSAQRRAKSLHSEDAELVSIPECDPNSGKFKEKQCDKSVGCYCVDGQGFEVPGTRARSLDAVNCTNPKPCSGPMCRMLCPYGFDLDESGCEVCQCRDVCKGVKCPKDTNCEMEEAPCTTEPCPPVASCKQARSLDSLCSYGAPLTIPETGNPFLCGVNTGQPSCPAAFECIVKTGSEYGICCAANRNFEKPGSCPVVATTKDSSVPNSSEDCSSVCRHDLDCSEFDKCCFTQGCGKQCTKPANSTVCLQQKHIAELLSQKELDGKGYIPQCDESGAFMAKQCSRNGKVCWCVAPDGKNYPQSIGPAESVNCNNVQQRQRAALRSDDSYACDKVICPNICEYGYRLDRNGCQSCDCISSPCDYFECPEDSACEMLRDPMCDPVEGCDPKPTCLSEKLFVNPCPLGTPLTDPGSAKVVACSESASTCPSSHICVVVAPNKAGLCCANRPRVEPTKPGMCPFLSPSLCSNNSTVGPIQKKCHSDSDCEHSMKCCAAGDCTVCADPLLQEDLKEIKQSPTMCQYLRDADEKVDGVFRKFQLARLKPRCKESTGEFEEIQCDDSNCMCVDEYGAEIPGTLMKKEFHNLTSSFCIQARHNPKCLDMNCRLACDYGYETLDGCKICECQNPCKFKNLCSGDEQCEMVDIDCWDGHCPPLPFCIPKLLVNNEGFEYSCPKGNAFVTESNETLTCNPRARMLQCPDDFYCHDVTPLTHELGVCCPIYEDQDESSYETERKDALDTNLLSGNYLFSERHIVSKPGQCPYLIPYSDGTCETECETDGHCEGSRKCCLNSCGGTQCIEPLLMTACQHQKSILEHKARENGMPSRRIFIPECDETGEYVKIQSFRKYRWCVDSAGQEIQGTRVTAPHKPNCQKPSQCPQTQCSLQCEFGFNFDSSGCPICECKPSPCDTDVKCGIGEECRMMQLNCINEPCPPVPLCLPRLDNPCAYGAPLSFEETGERVPCGPGFTTCPSSHKCNISPFGEYAVCCPKPKEVCFEKQDPGNCKAVITKWFFNTSSNECQPFYYSGCGGNNNQFNSKAECLSVCPALTHCERIREKNLELVHKYHHLSYIPKCNPLNGEWESTQCFDEVGMCWCVNKKGEPVKGTMTNGIPQCQTRRGRLLASASSSVPQVCDPGVTVHKCNKTRCENKICLGYPNARCMINPCGGCHERWVSEDGSEVDCNVGLGKCHKEMQRIMNSAAWLNQGFSAGPPVTQTPDPFQQEANLIPETLFPFQSAASSIGNTLSEILFGERPSRELLYPDQPARAPVTTTSTKVTPIFANFGGHKVMGMMSSSVTIMGPPGSSSASGSADNEAKTVSTSSSPVRSIADILAEMMASPSENSEQRQGYFNEQFVDLMPTSSQPWSSREMLPPMPAIPDFAYGGSSSSSASSEEYDTPHLFRIRRRRDTSDMDMSVDMEVPDNIAMESGHAPNIMVSILPAHKVGNCPKPSHFALFNLLTGACSDECHFDNECAGSLKCCLSNCGMKCSEPEIAPEASILQLQERLPFPSPSLLLPKYEDLEPLDMVVALPQCDILTGDYNPVQSQGELSWCVTPDGVPISETLTRGNVLCSRNGTILQRYMKGPVCLNPEQTPMICKDQCLHASCPQHPDAVCMMDVCNNCQPTFYKNTGEKVLCEHKCEQPPAEPGFCRAAMRRYTFNSTSGKCDEFTYGGCQGNDNNFHTLRQCQNECENNEYDVCSQPVKPGPCRASMTRWYFNGDSQACEKFDYGGCGGNSNNFMSKEHCEMRCPDVVLCPNMENGEMKTCSRASACKNLTATCPNLFAEDYVCSVDPCRCTAQLKDFQGRDVQCDQISSNAGETELKQISSLSEPEDAYLDADIIVNESNNLGRTIAKLNLANTLLKVNFDFGSIPMRTRCEHMSRESAGSYGCDVFGRFNSEQCIPDPSHCFCVDDAGILVESSGTFAQRSRSCPRTPIKEVQVSVNFPLGEETGDVSSVQLGVEMQELFRALDASLDGDKVQVEVLPGSTNLKFSLVGENKEDVAYLLELMVYQSMIGVEREPGSGLYAADASASKFRHVRINEVEDEKDSSSSSGSLDDDDYAFLSGEEDDKLNEIPVVSRSQKVPAGYAKSGKEDSVSAESLAIDLEEQNTIAVLLTVVAAISAGLLVFGLFLAFQKKKSTGSYPKKPFESLAFSSQVYEIEKKVPTDFPTFRVTPYVNEYKGESDKSEKSST